MREPRNLEEWIASRPEPVRTLLTRWPPGSAVTDGLRRFYVVGATEGGELIVSPIAPQDDHVASVAGKLYICADCLSAGRLHEIR